jgi:hypothetical protein
MFIFVIYNIAFCESLIPPPTHDMIIVKATLKTDPVQSIRFGSFVAEFEKTTLDEIRDTLGSGLIQHTGDAAQSQYWLCYSLSSQHIWLISHGEMGGSDHVLTQVQAISTISTSEVNAECPQIPTRFQPISSNFGWIGTSQNSLLNTLGQPSGTQGDRLIFYYAGKKPGSYYGQRVEWDVIGYIEVVIVDKKVSSLYATHVTSY